jgi:hypothetical protein
LAQLLYVFTGIQVGINAILQHKFQVLTFKGVIMNKVALLIVSAALSTALFAQASTTPAGDSAKAKTSTTAKKAPMLSGTVASVDAIGNTLVVKVGKKDDTLSVDSATVIKSAGKEVKLADLATGAKVTVAYKSEAGKKVATKITEKAAAKPATPAPAK